MACGLWASGGICCLSAKPLPLAPTVGGTPRGRHGANAPLPIRSVCSRCSAGDHSETGFRKLPLIGLRSERIRCGRRRNPLVSCKAQKKANVAKQVGGGEEGGAETTRKVLQVVLWGAEVAYIGWLFLLPYAPSPKKVNLVAQLVRGMRVEDALLQLQVTVKRAAKTLYKVIKSARANASHNHGLDPERLVVAEAFVGKGLYLKRLSYHAKGRCGIMVRPHCRLTVVVREITAAEEAKIAMIKVMNYKKLTRKERQLVPHQLIETTPRWSRRPTETAHVEA